MANEQLISEIVSPKANEQVKELTADLEKANKELQDTIQAAVLLNNTLANSRGLAGYNQSVNQAAIAQQRLQQAQLRTQQAQANLDNANQRLARSQLATAAAQDRATASSQRASQRAREQARAYVELDNRHKELVKRAQDLAVQFGTSSRQFRNAAAEANKLDKQLKAIDSGLGKYGRNVGNYASGFKSAISEITSFATAGLSVGSALKYIFDSTRELSSIRTSLGFILNSDGAAANKLEDLKIQANLTGQEFFTLAKTYKSFIGAAIASNFDLKTAEKVFKSVTVAAGKLGLSSDQTEGALLALQQMISKGNVQAEELRGQLGERLPGAFALAAKAMGVTEKELNKLLQTGQVTANDLLPKLADQLDKVYGLKAGESIQGLNAEIGRLMSQLQIFAGESSALSKNIFEPIIRGAREVIKELNNYTRGSFLENVDFFLTFNQKKRKNALTAYDLRDSLKNSQNQIASFPDLTGKNRKELGTENQLNTEGYRKAIEAFNTFKNGISNGTLKDRGGELKKYSDAVNAFAAQIRKVNAAYKEAPEANPLKSVKPDDQLTSIKEIQKRISELSAMPGSAIDGSPINNRIDTLKQRLKDLTKSIKITTPYLDSLIASLNGEKNAQEAIAKDETNSLDKRLEAIRQYADISNQISDVEYKRKVRLGKSASKAQSERLIDDQKTEIDYNTKKVKINEEVSKKLTAIFKQGAKDSLDVETERNSKILEETSNVLENIENSRAESQIKLSRLYAKGKITKEQYDQQEFEIDKKYSDESLNTQIDALEQIISNEEEYAKYDDALNKKLSKDRIDLNALRIKLSKNSADKEIADAERAAEKRKEIHEKELEIAKELFDFGKAMGDATFTRRINQVEREKSALTERTNLEIANVQASTDTEQQKADRIAVINAKAASDQAVLDERIKQQKIKQARFDKAANIASIIMNTAVAVTKTLAVGLGFFSSPLAILTAALGAAQLATVIATPIPEYKTGKGPGDNYSGPAIVGDGGMNELVIEPDGRMYVTPDKPTMTMVSSGTQIKSGPEFKRMLANPNVNHNIEGKTVDISRLVQSNDRMGDRVEKAIGKQKINAYIETEKGRIRRQQSVTKHNNWISRNFRR